MTFGLNIQVAGGYDGTDLPVFHDDKVLFFGTEMANGALLLLDPAHSASPLVGTPENNDTLANIAWKEAAALLGEGDAESLACTLTRTASANVAFERSAKGGLHGAVSQTVHAINQGANIELADGLREYIAAHPDHDYYFSRWTRVTKVALAAAFCAEAYIYTAGQTASSNYLLNFDQVDNKPTGVTRLGSHMLPAVNTLGNTFRSIGSRGFVGSAPAEASAAAVKGHAATWGTIDPQNSNYANKFPSIILYRAYMEDLTVSGRSYGEVQTIDKALFDAAFGSGGRFDGDTFTAPATLAP